MNAMPENIYDPVKEWLENLPEWDNIKRLDTHMADMGMTIKAKGSLETSIVDLGSGDPTVKVVSPINL